MPKAKAASVSGRDHYRDIFQSELTEEAAWLAFGAVAKANSVEVLLRRNGLRLECLLELGCGTGAVIKACQERQLAGKYVAVDYSAEAIDYLREHSTGINCVVADITGTNLPVDRDCEVILLSHVIEHLEDPHALLSQLGKSNPGKHFIVEVPLENLALAKLKNRFRDRRQSNTAGHVQFFDSSSFRALLRESGLTVHDEHRYAPVVPTPVLKRVCRKDGLSATQIACRRVTQTYLPRLLQPLWKRLYYGHMAVLCRAAA